MHGDGNVPITHYIIDGLLTLALTVLGFFGKRYVAKVDKVAEGYAAMKAEIDTMDGRFEHIDERLRREHSDNLDVQRQILSSVNHTNARIDDLLKMLASPGRYDR